jgi:segregation and condensation protein B
MSDESTTDRDNNQIIARIEALLFVASTSTTPAQLASALELPVHEIEQKINILEAQLSSSSTPRGLRIQKHHGRVQLITSAEFAQDIERFLGLELSSKLSKPALETLAIIAYQQPVTRPEIDAIRGVSSDAVLKSLLSKGLIQEIGRAEKPGRPILYSTTPDFLSHFGLTSLNDLPEISFENSP